MPQIPRTICKPDDHEFIPKRQTTTSESGGLDQTIDVSEVFCRKCGTVCFLTQRESSEPSRIALANATN